MKRTLRVISDQEEQKRAAPGHHIGKVVGFVEGRWQVQWDGSAPCAARTTLTLDLAAMQRAAERTREVLLVFADLDPTRPVIVGLLDEDVPADQTSAPVHPEGFDALVDGKRVLLEARDEIVLRCGEASIVLRRNGRVIIRGARVETRARGVNRIKGGSVQIN